jgi:hypothetical protein
MDAPAAKQSNSIRWRARRWGSGADRRARLGRKQPADAAGQDLRDWIECGVVAVESNRQVHRDLRSPSCGWERLAMSPAAPSRGCRRREKASYAEAATRVGTIMSAPGNAVRCRGSTQRPRARTAFAGSRSCADAPNGSRGRGRRGCDRPVTATPLQSRHHAALAASRRAEQYRHGASATRRSVGRSSGERPRRCLRARERPTETRCA